MSGVYQAVIKLISTHFPKLITRRLGQQHNPDDVLQQLFSVDEIACGRDLSGALPRQDRVKQESLRIDLEKPALYA
ncbi:hypothetical protein DO97_15770 [Neosynechococcus sphagnicola sy1]|uniref:Uncharacterized protein n=1 Tax=Neosynechococcus sphagnicola sy1 TaxID=1497020 RepID=A0A098THZ7_9CYAN|nr:hypothetical protein DO97_15770 [Neosynechococcus sphagnicola sy1]